MVVLYLNKDNPDYFLTVFGLHGHQTKAWKLCDPSLLAFLAEPASSWRLWRALVAHTIYWTVRRERGDKDMQEVLRRLFGCSTEYSTHTLPDHLKILQKMPTSI